MKGLQARTFALAPSPMQGRSGAKRGTSSPRNSPFFAKAQGPFGRFWIQSLRVVLNTCLSPNLGKQGINPGYASSPRFANLKISHPDGEALSEKGVISGPSGGRIAGRFRVRPLQSAACVDRP